MNVRQLREALAGLPDEMEVIVDGYPEAEAYVRDGVLNIDSVEDDDEE
jgi:hypothetical protein